MKIQCTKNIKTDFQWHKKGGRGANVTPGKLNVKMGPALTLYFGFNIILIFSSLLLLRFSEYFLVIQGFSIANHIRIYHNFSRFSECWLVGS